MHVSALLKKTCMSFTGRLFLSDTVRNTAYRWAWEHIQELPAESSIIDIGSRDSLFPAFLAWRRYFVRVIERDSRFTLRQQLNRRHWKVSYIIDNCDFLAATIPAHCDAICSLFSLQHAGDDDIRCYRYAARQLRPGGLFLSTTEYRHAGTRIQLERDDGSMRIYGPDDISRRVEQPMFDEEMVEYDRVYVALSANRKKVLPVEKPEKASFIFLLFKKNQVPDL
jgi:SAM-dependent methyltransferase